MRAARGWDVRLGVTRVDRVVEDEQEPLTLVTQPVADLGERRLFLLIRPDPAKPDAERDEIGAHRVRRRGPDPPRRTIFRLVALGVGGRERRLADPA